MRNKLLLLAVGAVAYWTGSAQADHNLPVHSHAGTELLRAVQRHEEARTRRRLQSGVSANSADAQNVSALMFAADKGDSTLCGLLLDKGANVNARTRQAWTPLIAPA